MRNDTIQNEIYFSIPAVVYFREEKFLILLLINFMRNLDSVIFNQIWFSISCQSQLDEFVFIVFGMVDIQLSPFWISIG